MAFRSVVLAAPLVILSGAKDLLFILAATLITSTAAAQPISLEVRPKVGDTLHMSMDQEIEMSGTRRFGDVDTTRTVRSVVRVVTRAIVTKSDSAGTSMNAMAESVTVNTTDLRSLAALEETRRRLIGRIVYLWMAPDGETKLVGSEVGSDPAIGALFAQMPATLPRERMAVGATWWKEMNVPGGDAGPGGMLRAQFRLDSLSRDKQLAWISISGTMAPSKGTTVEGMGGTVTGVIVLDRRRGWLTAATTEMTARSVVKPPPAVGGEPMRFQMKVTQRLLTRAR